MPTAQTGPEPLPTPQPDLASTVTPLDPAQVGAATALPPSEPLTAGTNSLLLWPWLLAGLAIAIGAGLMFFRQRSRRALAGYGVDVPLPVPEPSPAPQPLQRAPARPAAPVKPTPSGSGGGIVSTRLRPWIELEFAPGRCIFDQTQTTIEFLIKVTNAGNAPARDLRIDAMLFNAGPNQDEEIGAFFAHPPGRGEMLDALPPLKGLELPSSVSIPVDRLQILEAAGRQFFVPLIALNARYRWSGGEGQTSFAFLLGRDGQGEKMKPFFTERGPRVFRGVGARQLDLKVRR